MIEASLPACTIDTEFGRGRVVVLRATRVVALEVQVQGLLRPDAAQATPHLTSN
jgi:hypothetical protein